MIVIKVYEHEVILVFKIQLIIFSIDYMLAITLPKAPYDITNS